MLSLYAGNPNAGNAQKSNKPIQIEIIGGGGGGTVPSFADNQTPAGVIDGANDTFTLAQAPNPAASLQLFRNGVLQGPVAYDYTLAGLTITFEAASIPQVGDKLIAFYRY